MEGDVIGLLPLHPLQTPPLSRFLLACSCTLLLGERLYVVLYSDAFFLQVLKGINASRIYVSRLFISMAR